MNVFFSVLGFFQAGLCGPKCCGYAGADWTTCASCDHSQPIAHFAGLDKITGRLTKFDVYLDETVQFGALQLPPAHVIRAPQ